MKRIILLCLIFAVLLSAVACSSGSSPQSNLEFKLSEDKQSYIVSGKGSFSGGDLVIPSTYQGLPVTEIEPYAFNDCTNITTITIGENIKTIANNAFNHCNNVKEVRYNAISCNDLQITPFTDLGKDLLRGTTVTIGKQVERIPAYLFGAGDFDLELLNIGTLIFENGSACKTIADYAFARFLNCEFLTLPDSLETIGEKAFTSSNVIQVTLPKNLKSIGYDAFYSCLKLVEIYNYSDIKLQLGYKENGQIAHNAISIHTNPSEASVLNASDDFIFVSENGKNYLIAYTGTNKDVTLPSDYKSSSYGLYKCAFYGTNIESVNIPEKVDYIGFYALESCFKLKYVKFEDPYGWKRDQRYDIDAEQLKDSVNAAELLGGGLYNYASSTWTKE